MRVKNNIDICIIKFVWKKQQKRSWSEDSGFESRAGLLATCWPNGKASDYGRWSFFFERIRKASRLQCFITRYEICFTLIKRILFIIYILYPLCISAQHNHHNIKMNSDIVSVINLILLMHKMHNPTQQSLEPTSNIPWLSSSCHSTFFY